MSSIIIFCIFGVALAATSASAADTSRLQLSQIQRGPLCALCKTLISEVNKFIKDNRTEESIEENLEKICSFVYKDADPRQKECDGMVKAYTREIVQLLADESDPEMICMLLNQCTYGFLQGGLVNLLQFMMPKKEIPPVSITTVGELISILSPEIPLNSIRSCVECKLFISYLQETFENPKSRETLRKWLLDNLCDTIDEERAQKSCIAMVNKYSDVFFRAIAEQLQPQEVCAELNVCKKKSLIQVISNVPEAEILEQSPPKDPLCPTELRERQEEPKTGDQIICDDCVEIVTKLDDYLSNHSVDDDVSQLIEQVCDKLPSNILQANCAMIVKLAGKEIVEELHTMDNPRQFCSDVVHLC